MSKLDPDVEAELEALQRLRLSHSGTFYALAKSGFANACSASKDGRAKMTGRKLSMQEEISTSLTVIRTTREQSTAAIVFSALCVESIINFAVDSHCSKFYADGLDKLDVPMKWVAVLKFAYGHDLSPDNALIGKLKELAKARNQLAHAKPRTFLDKDLNPTEPPGIVEAMTAVATMEEALTYLHKIDPTLTEWEHFAFDWTKCPAHGDK